MKWLPFATSAKISKVLLGLMVLALFKLALLGAVGLDLLAPESGDNGSGVVGTMVESVTVPQALAQDSAAAPATDNASAPAPDNAASAAPADSAEGEAPMVEDRKPDGMDPADWAALKKREAELTAKERSLKALEADLDAKILEMEALQAELTEMLKNAQAVQDEKVKHLVDVYANMKAKQAAAVLETLEPDLAVKILAGMKGRQAGEILTNVEPVKAAKLSEMLTRMQIPFGE